MKLCDCKFFADENMDPAVVIWLRSEGYDATSVVETGLQGCTDVEVLRVATAEERVVLSHDSDFGTLWYPSKPAGFWHSVYSSRPH